MSFNLIQFREELVVPTLHSISKYSPAAVNLLLGTMAQESAFGKYIKQRGKGPALGVYQMEPATHNDIRDNYIAHRRDLKQLFLELGYTEFTPDKLLYDLRYATIFTRLHYARVPAPLPARGDIAGMADYWKQYYNTPLGKGTTEEFINNYNKYVGTI